MQKIIQGMNLKIINLIVAVLAVTQLTACGKGFINGAEVTSTQVDGEIYGNLKVMLASNGLILPSLQIPILDPKDPTKTLARVKMMPVFGSAQTEFSAEVNISRIADIQTIDGHLLPNGHAIPIGGLDQVPALAIPVANGGVIIYLAFSKTSAMLGAAINIKEFQQISKYIGGLDIFPMFQMKNGVSGVAGLYTSPPGVDKNGLAFFVDASALLKQNQGLNLAGIGSDVSGVRANSVMLSSSAPLKAVKFNFSGNKVSTKNVQKALKGLSQVVEEQRGNPVQIGQ